MTNTDQLTLEAPAVQKPDRVTAAHICHYLASTYTEVGGYATLFEVSDGTGSNARRRADALILNLWPSRGMELVGYEIKISRADWMHEMKQPEKAWPVMQYCDRWFLIAAPGVAKADELPINWGHIEFDGLKARVLKTAPVLEAKPISRTFLGAMVRKPVRDVEAMVSTRVEKRVKELHAGFDKRVQDQVSYRTKAADEAVQKAKEIKDATGIDLLHGFQSNTDLADAIKRALNFNPMHSWNGLPGAIRQVKNGLKLLEELQVKLNPEGAADE